MTEASSSMNSTSSSSSETETEDESSASAAETEDSGEEDSGENDVDLDGERCRRLSRALEALTKYAAEKAPAAAGRCRGGVPLFVCMLFCVLGLDARARGLRFTQEIPGAFDLFCFGRGVSLLAEDDAEGALGFLRGNVPDSGFLDDDENEEESSEDEGVRSAVWFAS